MTSSQPLPDLLAGIYRHYKGGYYLVEGYSQDANDLNRVVVNYVIPESDVAQSDLRRFVRTAVSDDPEVDAWWDHVHTDGSKCTAMFPNRSEVCPVDGHPLRRRFTYIGSAT